MKSSLQKIVASENATNQKRWQKMAQDSSQVVGMRLAVMPWLWLFNPQEAQKELSTMFSEKQDAMNETVMAAVLLPWTFWVDYFSKGPVLSPQEAVSRASTIIHRTMTHPSQGRVSSNLRRLSS